MVFQGSSVLRRFFVTADRLLRTPVGWSTSDEDVAFSRWRVDQRLLSDGWAAQQHTLLRMVAVAVRQRLPLAKIVEHLSQDYRWRYRRRLRRLAKRLNDGTPLADAVEQTPGVLSPAATLALRFAAQTGAVSETLAVLVDRDLTSAQRIRARLRRNLGYLIGIAIAASLIVTFLWLKIFPSFREIFADFQLDSPDAFRLFYSLAEWVEQYGLILFVPLLLIGFAYYSRRCWHYFHRRWLPRVSRAASRLRGADLLELLSLTHRKGRPLQGALSTLARYHYDPRLRSQLLFARNEVEQGTGIWESLVAAKLITADEANALNSAPDRRSQTWTMNQLVEIRRNQVAARFETMLDLLQPAIVLLIAAGVLFAALAVLGPLFELTGGLS